jgi:hypothetical protein
MPWKNVKNGVGSRSSTICPQPSDRIQESEISMLNDATGLWQVRRQFAYPNEGATAATRYLLTESRSKIAGFKKGVGNRISTIKVKKGSGVAFQQFAFKRVIA